jgi:transglutaminase-like putative cysteine protease
MPFRSFTPAETMLTERARLDRPLLLTVWVAAATFSIAGGQWFYLLAATFAVAVNMIAVHRSKEVYVHKVFVSVGLAASTVILGIEIFSARLMLIHALGHYLILLQLCKLFQRKGNRDYTQILALGALLMVASVMVTNALWFALAMLVYLALLCHTAMVFTLKRGLDAAAQSKLSTDPAAVDLRQVAWNVGRSWPGRALRRKTGLTVSGLLACGLVVFLLAPRMDIVDPKYLPAAGRASRLFGNWGRSASTGFSDSVVLGDVAGQIYQSMARLMTVKVEIPPQGKISTTSGYMRGRTYNRYADSKWSEKKPPERRRMRFPRPATSPMAPATAPDEETPEEPEPTAEMLRGAVRQYVTVEGELLPDYFCAYPAVMVHDAGGRAARAYDLTWQAHGKKPSPSVDYTALCLPSPLSPTDRDFLAEWRGYDDVDPAADPADEVELPDRVAQLARSWCADLLEQRRLATGQTDATNLRIAARIATRLRDGYAYTLDLSGADPDADGVEDFLFNMKRGHCEYFASALATMCCKMGVRARLVTGFVLTEYDSASGKHIVRGRDAHAWVEVFTPASDWVTFDPTPPGGRGASGATWTASARRFWGDLQYVWYRQVIGYDDSARGRAYGAVVNYLAGTWESFKNFMFHGEVDRGLVRFVLVIGAIGLLIEGVLIRRWVRAAIRNRAARRPSLPVRRGEVAFVRELVQMLSSRGLKRHPEQTLAEYAAAAPTVGVPREPVEGVVRLYYRIRWGRQVPSAEQLAEARNAVERLRRSASKPRR